MSSGLTLQFRYRFEAAHRFVEGSSKCSTPHGHSWYATLIFEAERAQLNQHQMTEEFGILKKPWKTFIDETVDHSFFSNEKDPLLDAMKTSIENLRVLEFPGDPTTEMVAALFLKKALVMYQTHPLKPSAILIEETPTNSLRLETKSLEVIESQFSSDFSSMWWNQADPLTR